VESTPDDFVEYPSVTPKTKERKKDILNKKLLQFWI
jgi:hypothetical protein